MIVEQQTAAPAGPRRSDAGQVRLSGRDVTGLLLCAEHYAVQYDLLAAALGVQPPRLRGIVARWRRAGYAQTGTLGPGPAWCWLTPAGMAACGLGYPARPPALSRQAHIRAVLAARLWLEAGRAYDDGQAWWRSERKIRAALPSNAGAAHDVQGEGAVGGEHEVGELPRHLAMLVGALTGPADLGRNHDKYLAYPDRDEASGVASA